MNPLNGLDYFRSLLKVNFLNEGKVPLNEDVILKCICGLCPVQAKSECAKPKIMLGMEMKKKMTPEMMKSMTIEQKAAMMPKPEDMPGPYCTIGVAACKDLDFSKMCICPGCQIFKEYDLVKANPMGTFCKNGKAV
jgi:hypothetical protein